MVSKFTKYGIAIIAAVLMLTAFAGAASATEISANDWNKMGNSVTVPADGIYTFNDSDGNLIYPKYNASTGFTPSGNLILDFTNYHGTFYGEPNAGSQNKGALFGKVDPNGHTLEIKGLNMTSVTVASSGKYVGGIIGLVNGESKGGTLNITNCHLKECTVKSTGGTDVGGLVGEVLNTIVNFTGCTVENSTIGSKLYDVGGLLGWSAGTGSVSMDNCSVDNCTITGAKNSNGDSKVGGLIGSPTTSATIRNCTVANCTEISGTGKCVGGMVGESLQTVTMDNCSVEKSTIRGTGADIGGLVGNSYPGSEITITVTRCKVLDCNVTSTEGREVGGMVGQAWKTNVNFTGCMVANSTITAPYSVGGLLGYAKNSVTADTCSVVNCSINGTSSDYGVGGLVGNAGYTSGASGTMIVKDCKVLHCDVKHKGNSVGGLVGIEYGLESSFERCMVANSTITSTRNNVGGLLGNSSKAVTMDNCSVENSAVNGAYNVGGMVGKPQQAVTMDYCSVENCTITGENDGGEYSDVGGLVGYHTSSATIRNCTVANCTSIKGTAGGVGGLVGYAGGKLTNTDCSVVNCTSINGGGKWIGGLAGAVTGDSDVTRCKVLNCTVKSTGEKAVGGLVGQAYLSTVNFTGCTVADSTITSETKYDVGGLVGEAYGSSVKFTGCTVADSTISSAQYGAGGLLGYSDTAVTMGDCSVDNCTITGGKDTSSGNSDVGGLIGWHISSATISNCTVANCTEISGTGNNVGGMVGYAKGKLTTTDCSVVNCTSIQGKGKWIGGLVGGVKLESVQTHTFTNCSVISCSITGTGAEIGGLIGNIDAESYVNKIIVTRCKVLDCTVQSTAGYEAGGMIGQAWYASVDFTSCIVANSTITAWCSVGGLLGYAKNSVTIENSSVVNCSIKRNESGSKTYGVGGLVGNAGYTSGASGTMIVKDCKVLHCDIVNNGGESVGGMVGLEYGQASSFERCIVANSTIASTAQLCVGGLVGYSNQEVALGNCSVENCAVTGVGKRDNGNAEVGGLVGRAFSITRSTNCEVKNCVIAAGGKCAGGLFGLISNDGFSTGTISELQGCSVKNSTISGTKDADRRAYVGGLVGYARFVTADKTSDNKVEDCAVNGGEQDTGLVSGQIGSGASITCDTTGTNYLYTGSGDTITLCDKTGAACSVDADFWKKISYSTGQKSGSSAANVSNIGEYGKVGGYGFGSLPKYTVTYDGNGATSGTVPIDRNSPYVSPYTIDVTVTVLSNTGSLAKTGSTFGGWNTKNDGTGTAYAPGSTFTIKADTTLYAKWDSEWYDVKFFMNGHGTQVENKTVAHGDKVTEPPAPSEEGFTFNGWYNDTGLSTKYDFSTPVTANLNLYANWTEISTYTITNNTVNGTVTANKAEAVAGDKIHVDAVADTGYHFVDWNVTNATSKIAVDAEGNFTMPASNVNAGANFTANLTHVGFNNGTGTQTIDNTFGTSTKMPATPTKEGFAFNGWNVSLGSGQWADFNSSLYNDNGVWNYTGTNGSSLDVHANWTEIPTYTITNNTVNGTVTPSKGKAAAGDKILVVAVAATGHHFVDWNVTNATSKIAVDAEGNFTMPASNVNAGANFTANVTHVDFNNSTGTQTIDNTFGTSTKMPATPTKEGFTFNGWNVSTGSGWADFNSSSYNDNGVWNYTGTNGSNLDVHANFTANDYAITILPAEHGDAVANKTEGCHIHDTIKLTATPHAGYMFVSWNSTDTLNFTNSTANPYQFQMNATDLEIQPNFDITSIIVQPGQVANASLMPYNDCPNEVVFYRLENEAYPIHFIASSEDAGVPASSSSGYRNMDIFATFQINRAPDDSGSSDIVLNVTLDGSANPGNIYLKHYNTTTETWDAGHIAATARTNLGDNTYQYTFTTSDFSPFAVVSETKISSPPSSSSGGNGGATIILTETPTTAPTATPTLNPTATPTTQPTQTQKSPAPFAGIIAGLGAALVLARMRR